MNRFNLPHIETVNILADFWKGFWKSLELPSKPVARYRSPTIILQRKFRQDLYSQGPNSFISVKKSINLQPWDKLLQQVFVNIFNHGKCLFWGFVLLLLLLFPFFGCPTAYGVPRPGVCYELPLAAYATATATREPLNHCGGLGIKPASWCCRDAANSVAPQWEGLGVGGCVGCAFLSVCF